MKTTTTSSVRINTVPDSDLKIVNAARVSFAKEVDTLSEGDAGLIRYLAKHKHWTPFSHVRDAFFLCDVSDVVKTTAIMQFFGFSLSQAQSAGMVKAVIDGGVYVKHSLYGWAGILNHLAEIGHAGILEDYHIAAMYTRLAEKYPLSVENLLTPKAISMCKVACDLLRDYPSYSCVIAEPKLDHPEFIDFTMIESVPIFVARQRFKHMVGVTYNEVSRRYVSTEPTMYIPEVFRGKHENKKQGSTDEPAEYMTVANTAEFQNYIDACVDMYNRMVANYVCPEQARMILNQNMMTEYYVTSNLAALDRLLEQRLDEHAQLEIRELAQLIKKTLNTLM